MIGVRTMLVAAHHRVAGLFLEPHHIERLGEGAHLHRQHVAQVLGLDLAALFLPKAIHLLVVATHDDVGVGAADRIATLGDLIWRQAELLRLRLRFADRWKPILSQQKHASN